MANHTAYILASPSRVLSDPYFRFASTRRAAPQRANTVFVRKRARCNPVASASTPPPTESRLSTDAAPFTGHTLAEAGESRWAPWWLLIAFRAFFALVLAVSNLAFLWVAQGNGITDMYMYITLTLLFWGPAVQSIGFCLLSACSLRARPNAKLGASAAEGGRLANISVPVYQAGTVMGLVYVALLGDWVVGLTSPLFFLVDSLILGAKVRFRFVYNWIPASLFAVYLALFCAAWVHSFGVLNLGFMAFIVVLCALLCFIGGSMFTLLTRALSK